MTDGFSIELVGDTQVVARLASMEERVYAALVQAMTRLAIRLHAIVIENLSGAVLKRRTGRLASAQNWRVDPSVGRVDAVVGFNARTVPYGVVHEWGVDHSWIIRAVRAKALRFEVGGSVLFRKQVTHPPLPERSFLRSALTTIRPEIAPTIAAALAEARL